MNLKTIKRQIAGARPARHSSARRVFLKAAGLSLALPWLEEVSQAASKLTSTPARPQRFAFVYTPNGYNQETITPQGTGHDWQLSYSLEPLEAIKRDVTMVTGLDRKFVPGTGVHAQCGSCWLTSSAPEETLDGGFPTNTTIDQMIARKHGTQTPLPSMELSCNDHQDNRETKYFETISWYGPGHATNTEKNPREVFNRLFGRSSGGGMTASLLDPLLSDAQSLHRQLGKVDQAKLEEYLESLRATERRIQMAEQSSARLKGAKFEEPVGIPKHRGEYIRLMYDLMHFAFQQDLTRVATLLIDPERWDSPRMFHGVFETPQNHHVLTHTKGDEAKQKLAEIDRFHVEQYAYFIERLKQTQEGEHSLLDSCLIAMGSGISEGNSHDYGDLQVFLAGGAGGQTVPKGHLHFKGDIPLANLWLTVAQIADLGLARYADSDAPIKVLLTSS